MHVNRIERSKENSPLGGELMKPLARWMFRQIRAFLKQCTIFGRGAQLGKLRGLMEESMIDAVDGQSISNNASTTTHQNPLKNSGSD